MIPRALYAIAFCVVLPLALALWTWRLDAVLPVSGLPMPDPVLGRRVGTALAGVGLAAMAWAMWRLWRDGGGLPMNAFPPPRLVSSGPYRLVAHPIYVGFALALLGAMLAVGSAAGVWVIAPIAALGSVALVLGYEAPDLQRRFGPVPTAPVVSMPRGGDGLPGWREIAGVWLGVLLPWVVMYEVVGHLPVPGATEVFLPAERSWPVLEWTTFVYSLAYPFVVLAPVAAPSRRALRRFAVTGVVGSLAGFLCFLVLPFVATPRPFDPTAAFGWLLALEQGDGLGPRGAFPSFHVFWALAAARVWGARGGAVAIAGWAIGLAIVVSCVTTGMHALADVVAGAVLWCAAEQAPCLWRRSVRASERCANGWREWRIGPVRIINHGFSAGAAAVVGVTIIGGLAGGRYAVDIAIVGVASLVGAGVWGQVLVGSRTLLRPFGYFGSVLGIGVALPLLALWHADLWTLAAATAVAAPWVQAVGRVRCLIQGCCHGAPISDPTLGIRCREPRSRICRIAHLDGVPIHPTPLYSIAANSVIGLLLVRLWSVAAPASLLVGGYLLLAGLSRFVEESYRGEPQTPVVAGLRLYQWFAIAATMAGALVTCVSTGRVPPAAGLDGTTVVLALALGVLHLFAMGVDFPQSDRRFSRLA
ncbi:MAG: prolipoprotein diacylglyceryl transferase [Phycisphaerales bacterium]|nr:prolipoprotein diacylglyceryl transferase [Phycisphaerales bacterium]